MLQGMVKQSAIEVHRSSVGRVGSPTRYCKQMRAWDNWLHLTFLPVRYAIQFSATGVSDGRAHSWFRQVVPVVVGSVGSSLLPKPPGSGNMRRITVCRVLLHDWRLLGHCHCHAHCSRSANTEHSHNICCKSEWSVIKTTFVLWSLISTDSMHSSFFCHWFPWEISDFSLRRMVQSSFGVAPGKLLQSWREVFLRHGGVLASNSFSAECTCLAAHRQGYI